MQKDHNGLFAKLTLDEIAKELNMSTTNLKRALRIERNLTDSMKELLDTGEITKTFASDTIPSLFEEENSDSVYRISKRSDFHESTINQQNKQMF